MARPDDAAADPRRSGPRFTPLPSHSNAPTPVRASLDHLAQTLGMTDVDSINALFLDWAAIVGAELANRCSPRSLRDRILTIEAVDQQWATELQWMQNLLIERCCDALGPGAVESVRIVR